MPKEWVLNSVTNRFQLNYKRNVGAVSEAIRACAPKTEQEWRQYYFENLKSRAHLEALGRKLYVKITEVIVSEIAEITEQDCIDYIVNLVINRTFGGYQTEIQTVYGQLAGQLDCQIIAAPDEWDRGYDVDFFIAVGDKFVGLQIKPVSDVAHIAQIHKERQLQQQSHQRFTNDFGGQVFYVYSTKRDGRKEICNPQVIDEIRDEIARLQPSPPK